MATVVHDIDAHADAVIVLRNPSVRFAVWEDGDGEEADAGLGGRGGRRRGGGRG
jgi:hypothetical protein